MHFRFPPDPARRVTPLAFSLALLLAACANANAPPATVRLVIDYGDGVQVHFSALPTRDGATVLDVLAAAQAHPHGITYRTRGSGGSAMVTAIGNLKNEGGGAHAKNWLYYVNDQPAEVGAGVYKLKPGDSVLWKFQVYE